MGNKKSKHSKYNKANNNLITKKEAYSPKFKLIKEFETSGSIYYCFELLDERLYFNRSNDHFEIYNINDFIEEKKRITILSLYI